MAESIISDGQNQPVPSDFHDRGQPPIVTTNQQILDSPLSPVSSEDLDISSPISDGYKPTPYQGISKPRNSMEREDRIAIGGVGDSDRLNTSNVNTSITSTDSGGSPRRKPRHETDVMKLSAMSGDGYTDSLSSSRPASAASSRSPYKEKEAERRQKEKEKEERFRLARQRMAEERQRKLVELKEQQRIAQENRERQLELRRKKIEELRKREDERRTAVEERRLKREATERSKREAILQRASDRLTRYEAWKSGGRKGGSGQPSGFGSRTPRDICKPSERPKRSSSHSALIRHSPNSSDYVYMSPQRRAISACSSVRRHCCVDINRSALNSIPESRRSFLAPSSSPPQRPKSTVNLNTTTPSVKLRENRAPRKPRPASVATSMPSFISTETPKSASQRSVSTDRLSKDKRHRKRDVIEEHDEKKPRKPSVKFSRHSVDRLSAPKQRDVMTTSVELPKRDSIIKSLPANVKLAKETPPRLQKPGETEDKKVAVVKPSPSVKTTPIPPIKQSLTPTPKQPTPASVTTTTTPKAPVTPAMIASVVEETPRDEKKDVEDYKARLAEARRIAREKAEKEAEEERRIKEIERLKEEERLRQEEEEQRRFEEEALRLAEEARRIEEERLEKAIEAENKRREEEAKKLEEEKKAKEIADQKAQEEAEQLEKERIVRAKKEEEERIERKKRLEMIMKRVKTDGQSDSSRTESPNKSVTSSPIKTATTTTEQADSSGILSNGNSEEDITKSTTMDTTDPTQFHTPDKLSTNDSDKPRFRSPLLQQMAESKSDSPGGERPKFKSPLLQNLLGKNKAGARVGLEKSSEESRAGEILNALKQKETLSFSSSQSLTNLSQTSESLADKESLEKNMSKSVFHINMKDEDKDIDTTESDNSSITDNKDAGDERIIEDEQVEESSENIHSDTNGYSQSFTTTTVTTTNGSTLENSVILQGGADSGVLMDLVESGTSLQSIPVNGVVTHDLIDSSISMQSVDSNISSTGEKEPTANDFEELIDLSLPSNKNNVVDLKTNQQISESQDLLNLNNLEDSEDRENRTPFIAFEENTNIKQDVPDLLS